LEFDIFCTARETEVGFVIDRSTELGAKVEARMEEQRLAWLTTVASDGTPQPNPVRF
jgi:predicted pyridoxine 5'-phosphate oxidase superfamily flavin-nucleotide-binding protein